LLCWVLGQFNADLDFDPDFTAEHELYVQAPFDPDINDPRSPLQPVHSISSALNPSNKGLPSSGSGARTVSEPTTSANPADATDADGPTDFYDDALDYLLTNHNGAMDYVDEFES